MIQEEARGMSDNNKDIATNNVISTILGWVVDLILYIPRLLANFLKVCSKGTTLTDRCVS